MSRIAALILAAGLGTRMKSSRPKVLHPLAGRPLIAYPIGIAKEVGARPIGVVIGPRGDEIKEVATDLGARVVVQHKPLGTAHACLAAAKVFANVRGFVLILSGDVPLLQPEMIRAFIADVEKAHATVGLISMEPHDPGAYGRVVRDLDGCVTRIVEAKDANVEERNIREVNAGIYMVKASWLFPAVKRICAANTHHEFYLPDILSLAVRDGESIVAHRAACADACMGINTQVDLAAAARHLRRRINRRHMLAGVGIQDESNTFIDADVVIGADTVIMPGSFLLGKTRVGRGCVIENGVVVCDAILADNVQVRSHSVVESSRVRSGAILGPFCRIRPGSEIGIEVKIGNFVEVKKSRVGSYSKANHLAYLGDATLGQHVNIGAGTITANYDGQRKHSTILADDVHTGSNTVLVAPVKMGKGAKTGAGAVVTKGNVPRGTVVVGVPARLLAKTRR